MPYFWSAIKGARTLKSKNKSLAVTVSVCGVLTGQQVSYLLDEVAQLVVALLHPLFAPVGFDQHLHSVHLGRVCTVVGLPHLTTTMNQWLTHVHFWIIPHLTKNSSLTILESLSTSCMAVRISWSRSLADLRAFSEVMTRPPHPSPPHWGAPSPRQPRPPQEEPEQLSPSAAPPHTCRERINTTWGHSSSVQGSFIVTWEYFVGVSHLFAQRHELLLLQLIWQFVELLLISLVLAIELLLTAAQFVLGGFPYRSRQLHRVSRIAGGGVGAELRHPRLPVCGWNAVHGPWRQTWKTFTTSQSIVPFTCLYFIS